jgi:hypothetical protein
MRALWEYDDAVVALRRGNRVQDAERDEFADEQLAEVFAGLKGERL